MDAVVRLFWCVAALAALFAGSAVGAGESDEDAATTVGPLPSQDEICKIFGGPSCVTQTEMPDLYKSCKCRDDSGDHCECVYFYQCDNSTGEYDTDGKGLLDIRKNDGCPPVELRCCKINVPHDKRSPKDEARPHENYPTPAPPAEGECGVRNENGLASKILNNEDSEAGFGELPWVAAILVRGKRPDDEPGFKCGGAILSDRVVLTAAHCVKGLVSHPGRVVVRAGEWDRESTSELYKHQDRAAKRIEVHDQYYAGNYRNDVALLVLETPFELGYHVGTICLPEAGDGSAFHGQDCLVAGWGKDKLEDRWPHRYLKRLVLPVVPSEVCERQLRTTALGPDFHLEESFLCAGGQAGKDTCKGDGGGPLACPLSDDKYQLAGSVSWGLDCGLPEIPGLYTNIATVRGWIDDKMAGL